MASNKRKSGDVFHSDGGPSVVVVTDLKNGDQSPSETTFQEIRQYVSSYDPLLDAIQNIGEGAKRFEDELEKNSSEIKSLLQSELEDEIVACKQESRDLVQLEARVNEMKLERKNLVQKMESLDKTQIELQRNISRFQEEATFEIDCIDRVEEEQKRLVPRLKTQISLYASTTGIRWDFAQDEMLSGQVVR